MFKKISRLFVIKTPVEAYLIIYALALGAVERGNIYLVKFPGTGGKLLFLACMARCLWRVPKSSIASSTKSGCRSGPKRCSEG